MTSILTKEQVPKEVREAEKKIGASIRNAEADLRKEYPFLNYQDTIGFLIWAGSLICIGLMWKYYISNHTENGWTVYALTIVGIAFFTSFLHELEHDISHNLYFKKNDDTMKKWTFQDIMFLFIWFSKIHANPWYRRGLHLKHHMFSGQKNDAEERLIGLGTEGFSIKRLAASTHPFGMLILTPEVKLECDWLDVQKMNLSSMPVAFTFFGLNKLFILYILSMIFAGDAWSQYVPAAHWWWVRDLNVLLCLPNMLRHASLTILSNCSHYYGDIPEKTCFYQNQILDTAFLWPMQIFAFHFGATHIVHHYVANQPFYIREVVYFRVKQLMIDNGVRINDFGTILRGNAYFSDEKHRFGDDVKVNDRYIAPNNSHSVAMALWILLCWVGGLILYPIIDLWCMVALGKRILQKYVVKSKDA